jgi:hypothetical protein
MAQVAANLEATLDARPGDESLTPSELKALWLFADLIRIDARYEFPGG